MNVIKLELFKISRSKGFYITLGVFFVLEIIALLSFVDDFISNLEVNGEQLPILHIIQFPDIWGYFAYGGRFFNIILALLVISQVAQEYQYKTLRQHLLEGMSRTGFVASKMVTVVLLCLSASLLLFVLTLISGFKNTSGADFAQATEGMSIMLPFFVQTFSYLCLAMFIAILVRKSYLGLILFLLYGFIAEPIFRWVLPEPLGEYLPLSTMGNIIPNPVMEALGQAEATGIDQTALALSAIYAALFIFGSLALLYKRDV
ncbi:ABC transporter permease [Roseivirga sp. BDSF3-8]|uniref:ABC transporter permease n=1 Tax=Roseivirga sp. BDSF3-8 TaxID=3241598 RepID=UPI003531CD21